MGITAITDPTGAGALAHRPGARTPTSLGAVSPARQPMRPRFPGRKVRGVAEMPDLTR